jgi:uncharacterized membrane protein
MNSRAKILGHGTHPLLVAFPIGLLISSIGFDILGLLTGDKKWSQIAFWNITAGCLSGWASMVPAAIDWWFLPWRTRAKRVATVHALAADTSINLFLASWLMRRNDPSNPPPKALLLSALGGAMLTVVGWLGGELVERLGVGVTPGAHLNAPNSLTHPELVRMGGDSLAE